jgi:hypothetical protein
MRHLAKIEGTRLNACVKLSEGRGELGNGLFLYQGAGEPQIYGNPKNRNTDHPLLEHRWVRAILL